MLAGTEPASWGVEEHLDGLKQSIETVIVRSSVGFDADLHSVSTGPEFAARNHPDPDGQVTVNAGAAGITIGVTTLTLDGTPRVWRTQYSGFVRGSAVAVRVELKVPTACVNAASGIGSSVPATAVSSVNGHQRGDVPGRRSHPCRRLRFIRRRRAPVLRWSRSSVGAGVDRGRRDADLRRRVPRRSPDSGWADHRRGSLRSVLWGLRAIRYSNG